MRTSAAAIAAQLSQKIQSPTIVQSGRSAREIAMDCAIVFALPPDDAGTTLPRLSSRNRQIVMPTSRTTMTIVTHHQSSPRIERQTSAPLVSSLSAMGSRILPRSVTRPRERASHPSTQSVEMAMMKRRALHHRMGPSAPPSASSSQNTSGAMRMRTIVIALGRFQFADRSGLPAEEVIRTA